MPRNPNQTDHSTGFPAGFDFFTTFAAILCGVRSSELMEEFGLQSEDWLRKWLELPHGIHCANTFSRIASKDSAYLGQPLSLV
jgi:DDE_Tnp_1-associated